MLSAVSETPRATTSTSHSDSVSSRPRRSYLRRFARISVATGAALLLLFSGLLLGARGSAIDWHPAANALGQTRTPSVQPAASAIAPSLEPRLAVAVSAPAPIPAPVPTGTLRGTALSGPRFASSSSYPVASAAKDRCELCPAVHHRWGRFPALQARMRLKSHRKYAAFAASLCASLSIVATARADVREDCRTAAEESQPLRRDGRLKATRQQLLLCVRDECPRSRAATDLRPLARGGSTRRHAIGRCSGVHRRLGRGWCRRACVGRRTTPDVHLGRKGAPN